MEKPSVLILQHLGTVEKWLEETVKVLPQYQHLIAQTDCQCTKGVVFRIPLCDSDLVLYPGSVDIDFMNLEPSDIPRVQSLIATYGAMMQALTDYPDMVHAALELPRMYQRYELALVQECIHPGGKVWWRTSGGIKQIKITAVKDTKIDYEVINPPTKESGTYTLRYMNLFSREEDAKDLKNNGYQITRA